MVEVAVLTTARELTNQYEFTQWVEHALDGKDPRYLGARVVDVITNCRPVSGLDERDAAVVTLSRETFGRRKVSPKTFADVRRLFGVRGTVDLVELMAIVRRQVCRGRRRQRRRVLNRSPLRRSKDHNPLRRP